MKVWIILVCLLLSFQFACTNENLPNEELVQDEVVMSDIVAAAITPYYSEEILPVSTKNNNANRVEKTIKFFDTTGTIGPDYTMVCDDPESVGFLVQGEGNASHIGHYQVINTSCLKGNVPTSPIYGFITAANGDEIHTVVYNAGSDPDLDAPPAIGVFYDYYIIGGTGRFDGASGEIHMHGIINYLDGTWDLFGDGIIVY